ncbi:Predicted dithiol-disulfide isomerase, DsbA family [Quadrisphaera granulorum]|uniref:Putative DsbA family dithiol-disulfide isomerase n=1 Tax=Quadrisphaera granulorum TaxID=317664 RepID=A0A315ZR40_9ACTN|nr:DsbA family oxidoreductase [Quadrisphaera granulorum]PWJ47470.1 putative DsbA family dithiol-disulfide isomerase [Quadrisphaera granulorum]SZE98771.1 Predicted dithiol-disulfide isomerase, DsbA family [Quadrisphaera granulorum]
MKVEIWSDVVCPWCYVGERRFEAAMEGFAHRDAVEVVWRSFELDPTSTSDPDGTQVGPDDQARRLATKFGAPLEQGREMLRSMTATAAEVGIEMRFDRTVKANTVDAHQVAHLALATGGPALQAAVVERLMKAHFTDGEAVGDRSVLVRLAAEAGLDADAVGEALKEDRYLGEVRADEAEARALGITGVPFFVIDRKYGVSGAQSPEVLRGALEQAWSERTPQLITAPAAAGSPATADACGPDGGAI